MVATNDITDAIESQLANISGLYPSSEWRDAIETPGAMLLPPDIVQDTLDGSYTYTFRLFVFVNVSQGLAMAARQLNDFMDTSGSTSITAALTTDRTLGGVVDDIEPTAWRWTGKDRGGLVQLDSTPFWGAYLDNITVYVSD